MCRQDVRLSEQIKMTKLVCFETGHCCATASRDPTVTPTRKQTACVWGGGSKEKQIILVVSSKQLSPVTFGFFLWEQLSWERLGLWAPLEHLLIPCSIASPQNSQMGWWFSKV